MKLYENVIKALFVSFRSERDRGVIRNAFAPRDGGHLLLAPLLSRSLIFSRRVSSFLHFTLPPFRRLLLSPSPFIPRYRKSLPLSLSLSLSSFAIPLPHPSHRKFLAFCLLPSRSRRLLGSRGSSKKVEGTGGEKAGRWRDLATEGE